MDMHHHRISRREARWFIGLAVIFAAVVLVVVAGLRAAMADHLPGHMVFQIGKTTEIPWRVWSCDELEQSTRVLRVYSVEGIAAGDKVAQEFSSQRNAKGEPVCGIVISRLMLRQAYEPMILSGAARSLTAIVVRYIAVDIPGTPTLYGILPNVTILRRGSDA